MWLPVTNEGIFLFIGTPRDEIPLPISCSILNFQFCAQARELNLRSTATFFIVV